jgi:hypothetical protein
MTEHRDWLKLQRETALEWTLVWLALGCLFAAFVLWERAEGRAGRYGQYRRPKQPHLRVYIPYAMGAGIVFLVARFFTDNYYLLDPQGRRILYQFKFFLFRRVKPVAGAHEILTVTGSGRKRF